MMKIWKLKKGHDFRLRSRHPWVFSNELLDSPKSVKPGEPVEINDYQGHFLARGYGNPHSLIAFRAVTFSKQDESPMAINFIVNRLLQAWIYRAKSGFDQSFRLCFSEADQLPGLILDRYVILKNNQFYQVFSYQLLTAGFDLAFKTNNNWDSLFQKLVHKSLENKLSDFDWSKTIILQRNDVSIRKLEGLNVEAPIVLRTVDDINLQDVELVVQNVMDHSKNVIFSVNLIEGQKTGFFLDQTFNIQLLIQQLKYQKESFKNKKIRILDLCCYMGQWSSQIVANLKDWGIQAEVHLVDISELALEKAQKNIQKYNDANYQVDISVHKKDILNLEEIEAGVFDIVISDPPAFVKNKKDIHQGLHAYFKINAQALKMCAPGAMIVSCTCSGAVQMEEFKECLRKSILRSGKTVRCITYGSQGWDHPTLMTFPEGHYLKMVMHQVE